jgi:hypothetical protein
VEIQFEQKKEVVWNIKRKVENTGFQLKAIQTGKMPPDVVLSMYESDKKNEHISMELTMEEFRNYYGVLKEFYDMLISPEKTEVLEVKSLMTKEPSTIQSKPFVDPESKIPAEQGEIIDDIKLVSKISDGDTDIEDLVQLVDLFNSPETVSLIHESETKPIIKQQNASPIQNKNGKTVAVKPKEPSHIEKKGKNSEQMAKELLENKNLENLKAIEEQIEEDIPIDVVDSEIDKWMKDFQKKKEESKSQEMVEKSKQLENKIKTKNDLEKRFHNGKISLEQYISEIEKLLY